MTTDRLPDDERQALVARIITLRAALERVGRVDKTRYDYPNTRDRATPKPRALVTNRDGQLPPPGERWAAPREVALSALLADNRASGDQ